MREIVKHENLPDIAELKRHLVLLAALDIIMISAQDDWLRVHKKVEDSAGLLDIFEIDNGAGDTLFVVFSDQGCILKGFDHESFFSPYARENFQVYTGIYDETPEYLLDLLTDPVFEREVVTFCIWRGNDETDWLKGSIDNQDHDDGGFELLCGFLSGSASDYCDWAQEYLEQEIPLSLVEQVYAGGAIDPAVIGALNPDRDIAEALREIAALYIK